MPQALVAAIPAILSAATTAYTISQSGSGLRDTVGGTPPPVVPGPKATPPPSPGLTQDPATAAAITSRLAEMQSQAGPGGFAPQFYTTALDSQFPGFDQMVQQIVSQKVGG